MARWVSAIGMGCGTTVLQFLLLILGLVFLGMGVFVPASEFGWGWFTKVMLIVCALMCAVIEYCVYRFCESRMPTDD